MTHTNSLKRRILVSAMSVAASLALTVIAKRVRKHAVDKADKAIEDIKLTKALIGSMDCSDAVAKY